MIAGIGGQEIVLLLAVLILIAGLIAIVRSQRDQVAGIGLVFVVLGLLAILGSIIIGVLMLIIGVLMLGIGVIVYAIRAPRRRDAYDRDDDQKMRRHDASDPDDEQIRRIRRL